MGTLTSVFLFVALFLGVTTATQKGNETSLRVLEPKLNLNEVLHLTCGGVESNPHPLARVSWVLISELGIKEEQLKATKSGGLELKLLAKLNGASVTCRSHARSTRSLLVLATPPMLLRIADTQKIDGPGFMNVSAMVNGSGQVNGGPYKARENETILVICESLNLPVRRVVYTYIVQRNAAGDEEKEINGSIPNETRTWFASTNITVKADDHNSRIYCLSRWFDDTLQYGKSTYIRSQPIVLTVEPSNDQAEHFAYIWVAVGVGGLGWLLVGVMSLCALRARIRRRRRDDMSATSGDSINVMDGSIGHSGSSCCGCLGSDSGPALGATILPAENAHSLAAANIKLTPQSAPSVQHEAVAYCNIEELNALAKRHGYPRY